MQQYLTQMEIDAKIQERKYFNNFFDVTVGKDYSVESMSSGACEHIHSDGSNSASSGDSLQRTAEEYAECNDGCGDMNMHDSGKSKKRTKKPKFSEYDVRVFADWYNMHLENPYPSKQEKQIMAELTGLTRYQVSRWFCNARTRRPPAIPDEHSPLAHNATFAAQSCNAISAIPPKIE
ncbi:hypothetical protein RFI_12484 [Reticulomyxa filosa]|uniref:Homeobox domain-containing protein n=1 Tax=Reticulomyxa filosa TaxID=46433 RepID=X6NFJ6_RETFI|nr:hypothetical protein RFI_33693 [Reticulomyxa filosa]ETO24673.1 hypothetical protein RFI_12484 [Reticulomyxa filosa]|eukprot:ETO03709.1 hypothetical protein RFI_33693 [Reticulomyxa filosa]